MTVGALFRTRGIGSPDFHITGGSSKKKCRISQAAVDALHNLSTFFKKIFRKLNLKRKEIAYHSTLVYNVAMNALFPKYWKWWSAIDDKIFLGAEPLHNKGHLASLQSLGINLVLSKVEDFEYKNGRLTKPVKPDEWASANIRLYRSPTGDGLSLSDEQIREDVRQMALEINAGGKVYVHCKAGRGRSAATVIAYYMLERGYSFNDAYKHVKAKRHQVFLTPFQKSDLERLTQLSPKGQ